MKRSPNLTATRVRAVADTIRRMHGVPTWDRIVRAVAEEMSAKYTRQALQAHSPIKSAYDARKRGDPAALGGQRLSSRARAIHEREKRDRLKIVELQGIIDAYHDRFARWIMNAHNRNLSEAIFDHDLGRLNRKRTPEPRKRNET
jgi:hypothetical protein